MAKTHHLHYLCIECPLGCRLEVDEDDGENVVEVRGYTCKKGKVYAEQEHKDPRRMVTTTVRVSGGIWPKLPVKTSAAVPKALVREVCQALADISVEAPVKMGEVIVGNVAGCGADIIATRDMERIRL